MYCLRKITKLHSGVLFRNFCAIVRSVFVLTILAVGILNATGLSAFAGTEQKVTAANTAATQKERIPTTANVSRAMQEIRIIVRNNHSLVTHRRLGVTQSHAMNGQIKAQIKSIRTSDDDPKLLKALEPILESIETGAAAIAKPSETLSRMDGLFQIDNALFAYGQAVIDEQWESLRQQ